MTTQVEMKELPPAPPPSFLSPLDPSSPTATSPSYQPPTLGQAPMTLRDRAILLFAKYVTPRTEVWMIGLMIFLAIMLMWRGSIISIFIGFFVLMGSLIFLGVIGIHESDTITEKEATEFLDIYYMHPLSAKDKPNLKYMGMRDVLKHIGRCIESVPQTRKELLKTHKKNVVDDWEGPVREWVTKIYNRKRNTKTETKKAK